MKIALFGARGSGKNQLSRNLKQAFRRSGWKATLLLADAASLPEKSSQIDLTLLIGIVALIGDMQAEDQIIRTHLKNHGVPHTVLYGSSEERLAQALTVIEKALVWAGALPSSAPEPASRPWVWVCDTCSEPQCEHRLLTDLLSSKRLTAP